MYISISVSSSLNLSSTFVAFESFPSGTSHLTSMSMPFATQFGSSRVLLAISRSLYLTRYRRRRCRRLGDDPSLSPMREIDWSTGVDVVAVSLASRPPLTHTHMCRAKRMRPYTENHPQQPEWEKATRRFASVASSSEYSRPRKRRRSPATTTTTKTTRPSRCIGVCVWRASERAGWAKRRKNAVVWRSFFLCYCRRLLFTRRGAGGGGIDSDVFDFRNAIFGFYHGCVGVCVIQAFWMQLFEFV